MWRFWLGIRPFYARVRLSFRDDCRIGGLGTGTRREIGRRAQDDLIELDAVFPHLNAERMRSAGGKRDRGRLREPISAILPSPTDETCRGDVGCQVDQQSGRGIHRVGRRVVDERV